MMCDCPRSGTMYTLSCGISCVNRMTCNHHCVQNQINFMKMYGVARIQEEQKTMHLLMVGTSQVPLLYTVDIPFHVNVHRYRWHFP